MQQEQPVGTPLAVLQEDAAQATGVKQRVPRKHAAPNRSWRPAWSTWVVFIVGIIGLGLLLYPAAASWFSSYNQSLVVDSYSAGLDNVDPDRQTQLRLAKQYNSALTAGVALEANGNVPVGVGNSSDSSLNYESMLRANSEGVMARLKIEGIDVDLPVYHGTDDDTLLKGVGHLEGSHLPVGGEDTHAVLTAHRGLADATMFTNLDKVEPGDRFVIEVFGEVLTYEVLEKKVVDPEDTDTLRVVPGEDLVTLVTCTPLGINTHRILVTGTRVTPTPAADIQAAGAESEVPGFPFWALGYGAGAVLLSVFLWKAGKTDARRRATRG